MENLGRVGLGTNLLPCALDHQRGHPPHEVFQSNMLENFLYLSTRFVEQGLNVSICSIDTIQR